nr:hypothetical protein [Aeromicrobium sp.]
MTGAIRLGLRLARGATPGERLRAVATVAAHLVGVWIMLLVLAAVRAEIALPSYDGDGLPILVLTVVATVGVPVAVLLATIARLSAALRDRRLANLRVLGVSPGRTRVVAAVEAGAGAAVGGVLGVLAFWATRPALRGLDVAGRDWSSAEFAPWPWSVGLMVVALPLVAVAVALLPGARRAGTLTAEARLVPSGTHRGWRALPLPAGLALTAGSTIGADGQLGYGRFAILVAGGVLSAVGLIVVIPVFTRVVAAVVVRVPGRPSLRIAGRRLEAQPAGVSRIVAGLLVALFVVAGSRVVLTVFEDSTQYRAADRTANGGPAAYEVVAPDVDVQDLATRLESVGGVIAAYPQWTVISGCRTGQPCLNAFVGRCADLEAAVPDALGCRDDRPAWLDDVPPDVMDLGATITWSSSNQDPTAALQGPAVTLDTPAPDRVITSTSRHAVSDGMQAQLFIPISTPGVSDVLNTAPVDSVVPLAAQVDPRVLSEEGLQEAATALAPTAQAYDPWEDGSYDFVSGLRALTWSVAALVLSIGLLGFTIATIDRAVSRRAEMVSLQLLGTGRGVIRAAQWWEAAVPLVVGVVMAIGAGSAVGYGYAATAGTPGPPWASIGLLLAVSSAAAVGVAGLTVAACAPRIRAELIRRA